MLTLMPKLWRLPCPLYQECDHGAIDENRLIFVYRLVADKAVVLLFPDVESVILFFNLEKKKHN